MKVVDTVGAGDAFVGSLCAFLSKGFHIKEACQLAQKVAGISVQKRGTHTSYPHMNEITDAHLLAALAKGKADTAGLNIETQFAEGA